MVGLLILIVFFFCVFIFYIFKAIFINLNLTDSNFYFNKASQGGVFYSSVTGLDFRLNNCIFIGNFAFSSFFF
jgi:hypothetical protein